MIDAGQSRQGFFEALELRLPAPTAQPIAELFPLAARFGVSSVLGAIGDYRADLTEEEARCIARSVDKRQREFAAGRVFARSAMQALGLPRQSVSQSRRRAPKWPAGMLGSISHSGSKAWVVAASDQALCGLGADIEKRDRLKPALLEKLFTPAEQAVIGTDMGLATQLFCAKEAVYKATEPIAGRYIGFLEVETQLAREAQTFSMRYLGDFLPNGVMEQGRGFMGTDDEHALALFLIPPAPNSNDQSA